MKKWLKENFQYIITVLSNISHGAWGVESVKGALWEYATEKGRGAVLWPMRYALSGRDKSPDPFTLVAMLGKETAVARVRKTIGILGE